MPSTYFVKPPSRDELNALIDKAADIIRTAVDYKFILVLLLLKRMNDLTLYERDKAREESAFNYFEFSPIKQGRMNGSASYWN